MKYFSFVCLTRRNCLVALFLSLWPYQVKGPNGEQIQDFRDKISEKSEFPAHHEGVYKFCFTNKSPYHETVDFDILAGYFIYHDEHAKDG